jgi:hypothetical protein
MGYTKGVNRGGSKKSSIYFTYYNMLRRCNNPSYWKYDRYGGRGVKVCERWDCSGGFINFAIDMGEKPPGFQLDRTDNNGDYEPGNCRWVGKYTQMANTSNTNDIVGVGWHKQRGKWRARVKVGGKDISLGLYENKDDAIKARENYVYRNNCV